MAQKQKTSSTSSVVCARLPPRTKRRRTSPLPPRNAVPPSGAAWVPLHSLTKWGGCVLKGGAATFLVRLAPQLFLRRLQRRLSAPTHLLTYSPTHRRTDAPTHRRTGAPTHRRTDAPTHRCNFFSAIGAATFLTAIAAPPFSTYSPTHLLTHAPTHRRTDAPAHRRTDAPAHRRTDAPVQLF